MLDAGLEPTLYFYNPNIYPHAEYEKRKKEVVRYAEKMKVPFVDADKDHEAWFEVIHGHEEDEERGERCSLCFKMRIGNTAAYAAENGYEIFTSSLGISQWKDLKQVTQAGRSSAAFFTGLVYWDYNWRLEGGQEQMKKICQKENFYRQQYCGCIHSLRRSLFQKRRND